MALKTKRMTVLEQQVRKLTADPAHYPQTSRARAKATANWILGHASNLTTKWQRVTASDSNLFSVAETLTAWGLADSRREPARYENRRNPVTDKAERVGFGSICHFRLKPKSLVVVSTS